MIRLYTGELCIHCHRVRLALAVKAVDAERIKVDPDSPAAELLEQNPYGDVPTLVDRDVTLYEPDIIIEYLDERYPHPPLMPVDPISRAKSRLVVYRMQRDWYADYDRILTSSKSKAQSARRSLRESLTAAAELFEDQQYFLSHELTVMDITILPLLWRLPIAGVELPDEAGAVKKYAEEQFLTNWFKASLTTDELNMAR
ncbi:glutathione S-transferase N-terminal domain-containing protein [Halorhodospira halochloris]|uniref:glutathione S-transferase N-terminal domain-containing protein n=1 Tax=Halorhodospira halochloris TaxID=1052 RepID=UPI001EE83CE7|nr:glutathione S-transferase N-terminal domain-containing protein [Halorhodospira halochloris]